MSFVALLSSGLSSACSWLPVAALVFGLVVGRAAPCPASEPNDVPTEVPSAAADAAHRSAAASQSSSAVSGAVIEGAAALSAAAPRGKAARGPRAREILLTFDDGPRLDLTPQVLDILDAHGIKTVFFVNGWRLQGKGAAAERARALLREMVKRGHLIGNHTVHHYFLCGKKGPKIAVQEIEENAALIEQAIGMRPPLFRTPYGAHCKNLSATLEGLGIKPIGWDVDPQDWRLRDTDKVLAYMENALPRLRGRAIVLFHDVQPATVAALPRLLQWIDEQNAADRAAGRPELKIIDYRFLLPEQPVIPPVIDDLGRLLVQALASWPPMLALFPPLLPRWDSLRV